MGLGWEGRSRGWGWTGRERSGGWDWEQGYQDGATYM